MRTDERGYPLKPKKARAKVNGEQREAWFYVDAAGFDIYCHAAPGIVTAVRLSWRQIEAAIDLRNNKVTP